MEEALFDFYYDKFSLDGELLPEAGIFKSAKDATVERVYTDLEPQDHIKHAMSILFSADDHKLSLQEMDREFSKAKCNEEAKFGLLRNAVASFPELAQLVIFRGAGDYRSVMKAVINIDNEKRRLLVSIRSH